MTETGRFDKSMRDTMNDKAYDYGVKGELGLFDIIKRYHPDCVATDRYAHFDFIITTDDVIVVIELKTRTCRKDAFDTTYFPASKLKYYKQFKKDFPNKKCSFLICFGFPTDDADIFEYDAIQYKPVLFNSYRMTRHPWDTAEANININIRDLIPIERYLRAIK